MNIELQKTLKVAYLAQLRADVESGQAVKLYSAEAFDIDPRGVERIANLWHPEGLAERMMPDKESDFSSAVALYEAYHDLSPLWAASEAFWAYVAHTDLFTYVKARYPKPSVRTDEVKHILTHWFFSDKGVFRHALASLWWTIHLTVDDNGREDKYELSRILFQDYATRSTYLAPSLFIRHHEAMVGVLEFLRDSPEVTATAGRQRFRFIAKHFNRLGAVKQLAYLSRDFFRQECERIQPVLLRVKADADLADEGGLYAD